jgi:hypothetical protein
MSATVPLRGKEEGRYMAVITATGYRTLVDRHFSISERGSTLVREMRGRLARRRWRGRRH